MASDFERDLNVVERATLAPWVDASPAPRLWALVGGVLPGALVFLLGERESLHQAVFVLATLILVALLGAWVGWGYSSAGAVPRIRNAPPEFRPAIVGYFVGYGVVVVVVVATYIWVASRLAAILAAGGVYACLALYERAWWRAATRVRERLS